MSVNAQDRTFVTGSAGYIGGAISRRLAATGAAVTGGVRREIPLPNGVTTVITGDLATARFAIDGFDAVIHAAGLGHRRGVPESLWRSANVEAAINVARQSRAAGVKRFLLISTAHIHGRVRDGVVTDISPPNPMDHYAASKLQAEEAVAAAFGPGLTIIRPVAVIGPHCPGNLPLLMKLLQRRVPLPFASIANQRSFIDIEDLADLARLALCSKSPPPLILAAHPEPIATPALIRALASGMGVSPRLLPCPPGLLAVGAALLGHASMWQSLSGNFVANPQAAFSLGWSPAKTPGQSLVDTGAAYVVS